MTCCAGSIPVDPDAKRKDKAIDRELSAQRNSEKNKVKILLLGAGSTGKSTFAKQMRVFHGGEFTPPEILYYRDAVRATLKRSYISLLECCVETGDFPQETTETMRGVLFVLKRDLRKASRAGATPTEDKAKVDESDLKLDVPEIDVTAELMFGIWRQETVRRVFDTYPNAVYCDSSQYFMDKTVEIHFEEYVPSQNDIMRARVATTCATEYPFVSEGLGVKIIDVGGQRYHRKAWIHYFDDVNAVIYFISGSDYDKIMEEADVNCFTEALALLERMSKSAYFKTTPFIIFVNKRDIFKEKFERGQFAAHFGDANCESLMEAEKYYERQIMAVTGRDLGAEGGLYLFWTSMIDKNIAAKVFSSVRGIVITQSLKISGMLGGRRESRPPSYH